MMDSKSKVVDGGCEPEKTCTEESKSGEDEFEPGYLAGYANDCWVDPPADALDKNNPKQCCCRLPKDKEKEADILVLRVTQTLYGNVRAAPDDYHFFKITDILDSTVGHLLRSFRKLILIPQDKLSDNFISYMKTECKLLTQLIDKSVEALEVVCIQPLASHPIFEAVHKLESKLDSNSHIGLSNAIADSVKMIATEALFMMAPPPPSIILGITYLQHRNTDLRLTAIVLSHSSSVVSISFLTTSTATSGRVCVSLIKSLMGCLPKKPSRELISFTAIWMPSKASLE